MYCMSQLRVCHIFLSNEVVFISVLSWSPELIPSGDIMLLHVTICRCMPVAYEADSLFRLKHRCQRGAYDAVFSSGKSIQHVNHNLWLIIPLIPIQDDENVISLFALLSVPSCSLYLAVFRICFPLPSSLPSDRSCWHTAQTNKHNQHKYQQQCFALLFTAQLMFMSNYLKMLALLQDVVSLNLS